MGQCVRQPSPTPSHTRCTTVMGFIAALDLVLMQPYRKGWLKPTPCHAAVSLDYKGNHLRGEYKPWPPAQHPESLLSAPGGGRRPAVELGTLWSTDGNAALTPHGKHSS